MLFFFHGYCLEKGEKKDGFLIWEGDSMMMMMNMVASKGGLGSGIASSTEPHHSLVFAHLQLLECGGHDSADSCNDYCSASVN